jgi:F-type H+-transporting ATPase subunit epsilon
MLSLEIITPEKTLVKEEVDMVEARGVLGEFGILPGHTQFLTILDIVEVRYAKEGKTVYLSASSGFAEVTDDKVTMLLDTGELAEDIDVERAKRARERAESQLKTISYDHTEYLLYEMALYRAITRISVASKKLG